MNKRPYLMWYDGSGDAPIQQQVDDPQHLQFVPQGAANPRSILGADGLPYTVGDGTHTIRAAKNIIWSSEGYVSQGSSYTSGVTIPALTANQKKATGSAISASTGNIGTLLGLTPPPLDFSAYRTIAVVTNVVSFAGGTSPSIQFELDVQDDTGTPVSFPLWKGAAATAAAGNFVALGANLMFPEAATAPAAAPTGFGLITVPASWTWTVIGLPFLPQGNFQWTVVSNPTAIVWSAWIYGIN